MMISDAVRRSAAQICFCATSRSVMRCVAMVGAFTLLLLACGSASAQGQEGIVITNDTGRSIEYQYCANYNDGNGSDRRYFAVAHAAGRTLALRAAEVQSYGILLRLPDGSARKLFAQQGPFKIRIAENPFSDKVFFDVLDREGQNR